MAVLHVNVDMFQAIYVDLIQDLHNKHIIKIKKKSYKNQTITVQINVKPYQAFVIYLSVFYWHQSILRLAMIDILWLKCRDAQPAFRTFSPSHSSVYIFHLWLRKDKNKHCFCFAVQHFYCYSFWRLRRC